MGHEEKRLMEAYTQSGIMDSNLGGREYTKSLMKKKVGIGAKKV